MRKLPNLTLIALLFGGLLAAPPASAQDRPDPDEVYESLTEGNERFAVGEMIHPNLGAEARQGLISSQAPTATVLACVDSRVPPELVFDSGLGDMLVIRTAGEALDGAALGSIQYGVGVLETPLLVVLGHENCGAVKAAIDALEAGVPAPGAIHNLVENIAPAVVRAQGQSGDLFPNAVREQVRYTMEVLKGEALIKEAVEEGRTRIVGGVYDLDTGEVEFLNDDRDGDEG